MKNWIFALLFISSSLFAASTYQLEDVNGQASWQVSSGSSFEVYLRIINNDQVGIINTTIQFDATAFSITPNDVQGLTNNTTGENYVITNLNISESEVSFMISTSAFATGFPNNTRLVKLTFKALANNKTAKITPINTKMTSITGDITVSPLPTGVTITIQDQTTLIPSTYSLEDQNGQINWSVGLNKSTDVYLKIDNRDAIGIVDTSIEYDPNIFSVADIQGLNNPTTGETYAVTKTSINDGQLSFSVSTTAFATGFPTDTHIAKITFRSLQQSNGSQIKPISTQMTNLSGSFTPQFTPTGVLIRVITAIPGDANGDGQVTVHDAYLIYNIALGNQAPNEGADCNEDGQVTVHDAYCAYNKAISV